MAETPQKHEPTNAASPEKKRKFSLARLSPKTHSAQVLAVCSAVLLAGVVGYVIYSQVQSDDIVVGDTRITAKDRNDYSKLIDEAKKQNPDLDFGGKAGEVALNDLLLNAAFKQEAKDRNQPLIDEDLIAISGQEFTDNAQKQAYIDNMKNSTKLVRVRAENEAYKNKFNNALLAKKDLLIVGITFDSPYFNRLPSSEVQRAYEQSVSRLQRDIQPLMKNGTSKEDIAQKVDINLFDDNTADDTNPDPYFQKPVATIDLEQEYSSGTWEFNDLNDNSYIRGNVGKLYDTDKKIAELKNVGDTTGVFASKMGRFMTIRLEKKSAGIYNSWDDFLSHYKNKYGGEKLSMEPVVSAIQAVANKGLISLTSIGLEKARAQGVVCAEHKVKIIVRAYDVTNNAFINNATKLRMDAPAGGCASSARTVVVQAGTGNNTINDNCFTPVPQFNVVSHPSGYAPQPVAIGSDERSTPNTGYNQAGMANGLPDWKDDALNGKTVYTTFYYHGWELNPPVSQVNGGGGWKQTVYKGKGEWVRFRHRVSNKGPATASFHTWRNYTYAPDSSGVDVTLGPGGVRFIPNEEPGESFRVPDSAENGDRFCQSQSARPGKSGKDNILTSERACVVVICTDQGDCNEPTSGNPDFHLELSCSTGIHITGLSNPAPRQNDNVAIRVRVYPHQQGSGIVVDQNGNPQSDDNFVFRTRGDFNVPWPPGYGNISWRVDVRAYAYGTYNNPPKDSNGRTRPLNSYTTLKANYRVSPCPSWDLTPSTDGVGGFIEQGGTVDFRHYITNTDPFGQGGTSNYSTNICVISNYDIYNPNAGVGGERCAISRSGVSVGLGTTLMSEDSTTLLSDGNTPLGSTYCQRYRVDPVSPGGGGRESSNACTKVVGGKTYLSVQPANVDKIEPGKTGTVTASTTTNSYASAPGYDGYGIGCVYNVVSYLPYGGTQTKVPNTDCSHHINSGGTRSGIVRYSYQPTPSEIGSKICVSVSIWSANGNGNLLAAGYQPSGTSCFDVVAKPYMKVLGGDVAAGSCTGGNSIIAGWNKLSDQEGPTGNGNFGAGTRYAAFAQGIISSFASGQHLPQETGFGYSPTNLSFANTSTNPGSGNFGGNFSGTPCVSSYFGTKPSNPSEVSAWPGLDAAVNTLGSKVYSLESTAAPTTIGGATIPSNVSVRLYVEGDVMLAGDITANYAGAVDASQMPNFTLIVKGNIYIQPGVKELYGTYVAEGVGKGNIYTCSNGTSPIDTANYSTVPPSALVNPYTQCMNPLTFTGAVVAQKVHLGRTHGSLYQDTNLATGQAFASEVFKYNPLSWVYGVVGPTTTSDDTYESMTTLPPVL